MKKTIVKVNQHKTKTHVVLVIRYNDGTEREEKYTHRDWAHQR